MLCCVLLFLTDDSAFQENLICHQLRLGLLKTVHVLLKWPLLLRTIFLRKVDGDQLLAHLVLDSAVTCSPLKPVFEQDDLEVSCSVVVSLSLGFEEINLRDTSIHMQCYAYSILSSLCLIRRFL